MKRTIPYVLLISLVLNVVFAVLLYKDRTSESEELAISEFVENQKVIAANFNQLVLNLSVRGNETVSTNNDINIDTFNTLKETDTLLRLNEELYLDYLDEGILSPSMRALNMEGLALMPILWNKFLDGGIEKELASMKEYNSLLKSYFNQLNEENFFQNTDGSKEARRILNKVSNELIPYNE